MYIYVYICIYISYILCNIYNIHNVQRNENGQQASHQLILYEIDEQEAEHAESLKN
jgi:hypothetical protein